MSRLTLTYIALPIIITSAGAQDRTLSQVSGTLIGPSGQPIRGGVVYAIRTAPAPWTSKTTLANYTGAFQLTGLHPGDYLLCAYSRTAPDLLNPCDWTVSSNTFVVAAGRLTQALSLRLTRGRKVTIEVEDNQAALLPSRAAAPAQRRFAAAIVSPLRREPHPMKSVPMGGRTFAWIGYAPVGAGHGVEVRSVGLSVVDERQVPAASRIAIPDKDEFRQRLRVSPTAGPLP